jgi:ABC-type antimicrobial peptide transport system permease subunit
VYLILGQGARLAVTGVVAGVIGAFLLRRLVANLLYGVGSADPLIFSTVPVVIVAVVLLACYLPAYRASKVDPMVALRSE